MLGKICMPKLILKLIIIHVFSGSNLGQFSGKETRDTKDPFFFSLISSQFHTCRRPYMTWYRFGILKNSKFLYTYMIKLSVNVISNKTILSRLECRHIISV